MATATFIRPAEVEPTAAEESEGEWEGKNFYCARCAAKFAVQGHKEDYHEDVHHWGRQHSVVDSL